MHAGAWNGVWAGVRSDDGLCFKCLPVGNTGKRNCRNQDAKRPGTSIDRHLGRNANQSSDLRGNGADLRSGEVPDRARPLAQIQCWLTEEVGRLVIYLGFSITALQYIPIGLDVRHNVYLSIGYFVSLFTHSTKYLVIVTQRGSYRPIGLTIGRENLDESSLQKLQKELMFKVSNIVGIGCNRHTRRPWCYVFFQ